MDLDLNGKVALVTGASRGLGYATARCLAREGALIALNSRSPEGAGEAAHRLAAESGANVIAVPGDVTKPEVAAELVEQTAAAFGGLDILVTNSGGPPPGRFESFDDVAWQHAVELNFLSHVRMIRAALPWLRRSAAPSVLAVASFTVRYPVDNLVLSNSVRAATVSLTKSLSIELGGEGIRFNAILPGWTETERVSQLMQSRAAARGSSTQQETDAVTETIPLRRMADPDEFARTACFLVSPAASYITGVMLLVDGGVSRGLF